MERCEIDRYPCESRSKFFSDFIGTDEKGFFLSSHFQLLIFIEFFLRKKNAVIPQLVKYFFGQRFEMVDGIGATQTRK
ncbi:MAG: hypothetical protein K9M51_02775 [Candidatus Gracilibacteria bacterium]|nr:hypothetical protein [Candidatus Gracilibacteria bacterium]